MKSYILSDDFQMLLDDLKEEEKKLLLNKDYLKIYSDYWIDCDYILKDDHKIRAFEYNNKLIIEDNYNELTAGDIGALEDFYSDETFSEKDFKELSTYSHEVKESDKKMKEARLSIKYRGGEGYHYGWWILRG